MTKWEYLIVEVHNPNAKASYYEKDRPSSTEFKINGEKKRGDQWFTENIPDELNRLGEEGWELIKIGKANTEGYSVMYTFKRPL